MAYRFFRNPKTNPPVLLEAHTRALIERKREQPVVLGPEHTTSPTHNPRPHTPGWGQPARRSAAQRSG